MPARHTPRVGSIPAVLLASWCLAAPAAAEWRRIDSPNFVVVGEAGARELRDIAVRFEGFRETLSRVLTERATATAVPTVVLVFPSDRAFTPFKPTYEGRPIELAGLFVGRRDINYIALVADGRADRLRVVFHEYAHLVISNLARNVPTWLNEGLAEYYSTYEMSKGGQEATIGRPVAGHLQTLAQARLLPLGELLQVSSTSPLYNEGSRRSVFYAQSWALTHLILLGDTNRTAQLSAYLAKLDEGAAPTQAWQEAFGSAKLDDELRSYALREVFRAYRFRFPEKLATFDAPAMNLTAADAQAILADFLVQQNRHDEAAERLADASKMDPDSALVRTSMALLDIARGDHTRADDRLMSLDDVGDWLVGYMAGVGIADLVEERHAAIGDQHVQAARRFFDAAKRERPELANALARLTAVEIETTAGAPPVEARAAIERARTLAPGRHDYALLHARVLLSQAEFRAARNLIGPFLSPAFPPEIRDAARALMGYVVQREAAAARAAQASSASLPTATPGRTEPIPARELVPVYRELDPGEQRLEGTLERIECLAGGAAVFHLRTVDGPARATAPQIAKVDFTSYRDDAPGGIGCGGLKPPLPVYLTWRPDAKKPETKIAVAVEFRR